MPVNEDPSVSERDDSVDTIESIVAEERRLLGLTSMLAKENQGTALCLSGGGIRSATFSLGVFQGFARLGRLKDFHYLSTVSGGTYAGTWLATWISRSTLADVENALACKDASSSAPAGITHPAPACGALPGTVASPSALADSRDPAPVRHLRAYSNFLTPVHGLSTDSMALAAIFARNLLLHWAIVIPVIICLLLAPRLVHAVLGNVPLGIDVRWLALVVMGCHLVAAACASFDLPVLSPRAQSAGSQPKSKSGARVAGSLLPSTLFVVLTALGALATLLATHTGCVAHEHTVGRSINPNALGAGRLALIGGAIHLVGAAVGSAMRWLVLAPDMTSKPRALVELFASAIVHFATGAAAGALTFLALVLLHGQSTSSTATFGVPLLLVALWLASILRAGLSMRFRNELVREWWGRASGLLASIAVGWLLLFLLVIQVPSWLLGWAAHWGLWKSGLMGVGSIVVALGTTLYGFWSKNRTLIKEKARTIGQTLGVRTVELAALISVVVLALLINFFVSFVLSRAFADIPCEQGAPQAADIKRTTNQAVADSGKQDATLIKGWRKHHENSIECAAGVKVSLTMLLLAAAAVLASILFGANTFSMNALYGNRLARAYLGASRTDRRAPPHRFTGFDAGDNPSLKSLAPAPKEGEHARLLLVINAALNLVRPSGNRLEWQQRKAAAFFMTPYFSGSKVVGFIPTASYASSDEGLTVGRAMAISGAAASPSMGYHSSPMVSLLLAFFNVRLGWWMPNPNRWKNRSPAQRRELKRDDPLFGLEPILAEMLSKTDETRDFIHLSDGGHFENLGLYEMVRRLCRRIVVIDAACDPDYQYECLENAIRKIRVDLGIRITFDDGLLKPANARATGRHWCSGRIHYREINPELKDGEIFCIKPVLTGSEPVDVLRYAQNTRSNGKVFPQQPTSDQFFDEAQFESYRVLGLHSVLGTFAEVGWPTAAALPDVPQQHADSPAREADPAAASGEHPPRWAPDAVAKMGLLSSIGSMSQAALLAGAVTVTAAATVTGTVALSNAEVRLSRDSPPVKLDPDAKVGIGPIGPIALDPVRLDGKVMDAEALTSLAEQVAQRLSAIPIKVEVVDSASPPRAVDLAALETLLSNFERATKDLSDATAGLKSGTERLDQTSTTLARVSREFAANVGSATRHLEVVVAAFGGKLTPASEALRTIKAALDGIQESLKDITTDVKNISPRETVRSN